MADSPHHILILDDDTRIRTLLKGFLQKNGYYATAARDTTQARKLLAGLSFDLLVCDIMMPGEDGVSFVTSLRQRGATVPVLFLTARGEPDDRIMGLEAGADDYMVKPFEPRELLLRIAAILRRIPHEQPQKPMQETIRLGERHYDTERAELWHGDSHVPLTATETAFMRIFSTRLGDTVSRGELAMELGRGDENAQERAVDVQITRLRRKIEDDPKAPRFLQTVRGLGYSLMPE